MDARLFRYLFENTSHAIVMTGCTWDKEANQQIRYAYSCETKHSNWRVSCRKKAKEILYSDGPIDLFVMGSFSIADIERLIYAIRYGKTDTVILPYVPPIQRFMLLQDIALRGMGEYHSDVAEFIRAPYLYLVNSSVRKFYFIYGNGKIYQRKEKTWYPEHQFECQDEVILNMIEELEGYRIPVVKAGYIIDNRMLFYFGYYGVNLHLITKFVKQYLKEGPIEKFDERRLQKMLLLCKNEFGDPGMDSLTMFCSPIEVIATKTDCVFNAIVIDKEDFCHANIESDEGRCSLKCMLYNDYDVCHCHRTEEAELRAGVLLLGNVNLNKYMTELKQRYHVINDQIRAITLPNCGNKNNWNSELMEFDVRKNAVFWICPLQSQTPDKVLREIKSKNARYRIIGLNENYGSCFNGFLTEKL